MSSPPLLITLNPSQFYDLVEIFRIGGYAPETNYLFLGESNVHNILCPVLTRVCHCVGL
jgi:serine/threonine-protein phosphatase PPG1